MLGRRRMKLFWSIVTLRILIWTGSMGMWKKSSKLFLLSCRSFTYFMKFQSSMPAYMFMIVTILFRYEMRFNMKTGLASQKKLSTSAVEFPRVNESYTGRYISTFGDRRIWVVYCQEIHSKIAKMLILAADWRS